MRITSAVLAASLVLTIPAFAGFKKGETGTMTVAQVRAITKANDNCFKDPDSGRYFLFGNLADQEIEKVLSDFGDSGILKFVSDSSGAFYYYPSVEKYTFFVEELNEDSESRKRVEERERPAPGTVERKS